MSNKRVIWTNQDGTVSVLIPAPGVPDAAWLKDIPADAINPTATTVEAMPPDRLFRAAWKVSGKLCLECPVKSKEVAHEIRRARRAEKFAPHDQIIARQLPGLTKSAEAERERIRKDDADFQKKLDAARSSKELRALLT